MKGALNESTPGPCSRLWDGGQLKESFQGSCEFPHIASRLWQLTSYLSHAGGKKKRRFDFPMFNRMLVADFKVGTCRGEIWKASGRRPGVIWVNYNGIFLQFPQPRQFYQGNLAVQRY